MLRLVGFFLRRVGEPLRSAFTAEEMRALLTRHRFIVDRDQGLPEIGAALSPELGQTGARHEASARRDREVVSSRCGSVPRRHSRRLSSDTRDTKGLAAPINRGRGARGR
jgi:hypothetical protein